MKINYLELLGSKKFFEWTPYLSCQTESEAPTVRYEAQQGYGVTIKVDEMYSLRYFSFVIRGYIDAISSGDNYAAIRGLPEMPIIGWGTGYCHFATFYQGIKDDTPMPTGRVQSNGVNIYQGYDNAGGTTRRGSSVAQWIVSSLRFDIRGDAWAIVYNEGMAPSNVEIIDD